MSVTMEKKRGFEKQMAVYGDGVLRSFLAYIVQRQDDRLLARSGMYLAKIGKHLLWQKLC